MKTAPPDKTKRTASIDILTLVGIAIVVYTIQTIAHEGIGHGLVSTLLGGHVTYISSTECQCGTEGLPRASQRAVSAAGPMMNLILTLVFWGLFRASRNAPTLTRYFLWLSMTVNGLTFAGYLAVPTLIGFGDWFEFIQGLSPVGLWRAALILVGIILYIGVAYVSVHSLEFLQTREQPQRRRRAWILNLVPYLSGGIAYVIAALFNPAGPELILISAAAASFGGTSAFLWMPGWSARKAPDENTPATPEGLARAWVWIGVGVLTLIFLIVILGPGVKIMH